MKFRTLCAQLFVAENAPMKNSYGTYFNLYLSAEQQEILLKALSPDADTVSINSLFHSSPLNGCMWGILEMLRQQGFVKLSP